jgi:hypothetical protein
MAQFRVLVAATATRGVDVASCSTKEDWDVRQAIDALVRGAR